MKRSVIFLLLLGVLATGALVVAVATYKPVVRCEPAQKRQQRRTPRVQKLLAVSAQPVSQDIDWQIG